GRPRISTCAARAGDAGIRRFPARRLPVPPGITASGRSVPTSAAAACMVVPSPPKTPTTSTPSDRPYSASRRASPGPPVASTSACHPAARRARSTAFTASGSVRAAAGLVMRSARATLELPLPDHVGADLVGGVGQVRRGPGRAAEREGGLEAGLHPPGAAEAVLHARAQVLRPDLGRIAEPGAHRHEGPVPDPPADRHPAQGRGTHAAHGDRGPDLQVVDGNADVRDEE